MKVILSVILLLSSYVVFATTPELKITSFTRVTDNPKNVTAEACGTLKGLPGGPHLIRLTTDYDSDNPGIYYTWVGQTYAFCSIVVTFKGTIQANVEVPDLVGDRSQLQSLKAIATLH